MRKRQGGCKAHKQAVSFCPDIQNDNPRYMTSYELHKQVMECYHIIYNFMDSFKFHLLWKRYLQTMAIYTEVNFINSTYPTLKAPSLCMEFDSNNASFIFLCLVGLNIGLEHLATISETTRKLNCLTNIR